ncbi:MAG: hypothetical protein KDB94_04230 [Acidobacteria bacterium]|nr:hypothetical protein [Acidobacteriota bacterium]
MWQKVASQPAAAAFALAAALAMALVAPLGAAEPALQSQTGIGEMITLTGEVAEIDAASRYVTLVGPFGGEITGRVQDDVKNLEQVKVGDMVTIAYFQSAVLSASRTGEPNPLFKGGEAATSAEGKRPAGYVSKQHKRTVTVVAVDPEHRSVVFQAEDGTLFPVEVERPEFAQKLQGLRAGDQLDVVVTEAIIAGVTAAAAGEKPSLSRQTGTLIVDRGEVVRVLGNTLVLRNEKGRTVKVTVPSDFKFQLDGKQATVGDLKPGMKLTRTAFRIVDSDYVEGE